MKDKHLARLSYALTGFTVIVVLIAISGIYLLWES
jgi:hypothetical protein